MIPDYRVLSIDKLGLFILGSYVVSGGEKKAASAIK